MGLVAREAVLGRRCALPAIGVRSRSRCPLGDIIRIRRPLLLSALLIAAGLAVWFALRAPSSPPDVDEFERREAEAPSPPELRGLARREQARSGAAPPPPSPAPTPAPEVDLPPGPAPRGAVAWKLGAPSREAATSDVRVRVTDGDGYPRAGVALEKYGMVDGRGTKTHEFDLGGHGEVEILGLAPGRHTVYLTIGDLRRRVPFETEAGRVTEVDVVLPPGVVVEGRVRHLEKGLLAGVRVIFGDRFVRSRDTHGDRLLTTSGEEGRYRFEEVPEGRWPVSLQADRIGYHPSARLVVDVRGPGPVILDIVLGRVVLTGTVSDSVTGAPISGVGVHLQAPVFKSTISDADGKYAFVDVPSGEFKLSVNLDGYGHRFLRASVPIGDGGQVLDIALDPAATLLMSVADEKGTPIVGEFSLSVAPAVGETGTKLATSLETDASGAATYRRIVPGRYVLRASTRDHEAHALEYEVGSGENRVSFVLPRKQPAEAVQDAGGLPASGLAGRVLDATTHDPLADVRVTMQAPLHRTTRTDAEGRFAFADVPLGACRLVFARDGYGILFVRDWKAVAREEGAELPLNELSLHPAATLHLELLDARGRPVVGKVVLSIKPAEGTEGTNVGTGITADADGRATYRQIVPGRYRLKLIEEKAGRAQLEAEVLPGENHLLAHFE